MGNSNTNSQHSHRKRRGSRSRKNSTKGIDSNVENFFKSKGIQENEISVSQILRHFSHSFIIKTILVNNSLVSSNENDELDMDELKVELNDIKQIFSEQLEIFSNSSIVEFYTNLLFHSSDHIEYQIIKNVFKDCLFFSLKLIGFDSIEFSEYSNKSMDAIITSIKFDDLNGKRVTTKSNLKDWILNNFSQLFFGFHNWFCNSMKEKEIEKNKNPKAYDMSNFMNLTMIWFLINNLPSCYTKNLSTENGTIFEKLKTCLTDKSWHPLYQSENHGLSLNRFQTNLFDYKAGTIVFIYCQSGSLYCVCSNQEYKESPNPYGDEQTRIFRLWEDFKSFNRNIFLNTKSRFLKLGLIFGYNQLKPVIKINEDFHTVEHDLSSNDQIISVEGWACGSTKAHLDQQSMKKWESKQIEKMRTVKIDAEWGENADKAILDLAGVKTNHSERGDM